MSRDDSDHHDDRADIRRTGSALGDFAAHRDTGNPQLVAAAVVALHQHCDRITSGLRIQDARTGANASLELVANHASPAADVTFFDSTSNFTPAGNLGLRGNGVDSWDGWPTSARLEELRQAWLDAGDLDAEKRVCRELPLQLWQDVPCIPMGQYSQQTCYRRTLTDVAKGSPLFFGVRPA